MLVTGMMFLFALIPAGLHAQARSLSMQEYEDSLEQIYLPIWTSGSDSDRYLANEAFLDLLQEALAAREAYKYPFDSLRYISVLTAPDKSFRLFSWFVPRNDGTFEFFGIIFQFQKKGKKYARYLLNDTSDGMRDPEREGGDNTSWYGAQYYRIILTKTKGKRYYTLLGWDGYNTLTNRKVIEVLTFRSNGKPVFGYNLFKCDKSRIKRYIFEYSEQTSMLLRYEEQYLTYSKRRLSIFRSKKKEVKTRKVEEEMIIFDRLVPMHPSLENMYEFYVPSTNVVDGFLFRSGRWHLARDVDARNPESPLDKVSGQPADGLVSPQ